MKILLTVIMTWLSSSLDLPPAPEQPAIKLVAQEEMVRMRYGAAAAAQGREVVALYDDKTKTVLLSNGWTGGTPAEVSVLVHELVHHLQNMAQLKYDCPAAREALAYAAQERWLKMFGQSLESEFGVDPFTLKISTACM